MLEPSRSVDSQYSADVSIHIETGTKKIEVAGCHENYCILREPVQMDPFEGVLVIAVDCEEYRTPVSFSNGISPDSVRADFSVITQ